jgi:DnaK suppressor protein
LPLPVPRCYGPPTMARSSLTTDELAEVRSALEQERAELEEQLRELEESSFSSGQSDLTGEVGFDDEYADQGTATFERERDLSIENNSRDLLLKVTRALDRLSSGTFGLCERCGKPIEKVRIKALPYVTLCIKDAQAAVRPR